MKIILDNIGPLKHVEMDMSKDLIVLCGPNNTGKTYAAYSVYNVYKADKRIDMQDEPIINLSPTILEYLKKYKNDIILNYEDSITNNLFIAFSTHKSLFDKSKIAIEVSVEECMEAINKVDLFTQNTINQLSGNNHASNYLKLNQSSSTRITAILMLKFLFQNVHIVTAERSTINLFGKELIFHNNKWIDNKENQNFNEIILNTKDHKTFVPPYNRPILDSLSIADDVQTLKKQSSDFAFFADEIEQKLLGGKIKVSDEGETLFVPNKNGKNGGYGLHISASIVKSLSSLVFYFRHLAQKGDFIIIDEPELSLHPDNQRMIARVLAKAVNLGFKVMFSTHSDYIIRELNNLIMLEGGKEKSKKLIKKYGYQTDELVAAEKVGVYLFKQTGVESLPVTESGFSVDTIDAEISKLNETSEDIYNTLFE